MNSGVFNHLRFSYYFYFDSICSAYWTFIFQNSLFQSKNGFVLFCVLSWKGKKKKIENIGWTDRSCYWYGWIKTFLQLGISQNTIFCCNSVCVSVAALEFIYILWLSYCILLKMLTFNLFESRILRKCQELWTGARLLSLECLQACYMAVARRLLLQS